MNNNTENNLRFLFQKWSGEKPEIINPLPDSGSYRKYYRISSSSKTALGVFNEDRKENLAFLSFSKHFIKNNLNVPEIYEQDLENKIYLIQDLGDITLFSLLIKENYKEHFSSTNINLYRKVIEELPKFQVLAGKDLDYSLCYPCQAFNKQSMMWDLNYFKYYFLKLAKIQFDEQKLENDFQVFTEYLLQADTDYFLYRDFQSRNILIYNDLPYFIDYQGGRKGALQYDLASLLFQAKAKIPTDIREEFLEYYIDNVSKYIAINRKNFKKYYYGYVLIRILQVLGAYGFRGFYEKKTHFLQSISDAINNLEYLLNNVELPVKLPVLMNILPNLVKSDNFQFFDYKKNDLTVTINSFSFKKSIPVDKSDNGGGFVFDCRALPNPGRYEEYKHLTGNDTPVIDFLNKEKEVENFLNNVFLIVDQSVEKYIKRNFDNLMVNFGCTGGQHRSVYSANKIAQYLKEKYNVKIKLNHQELKN
ncbi:MAG: phosphotransferase [Bacteroidales bacterium]|nr:phosphotransferase [Bacteroidales bacterium]